MAGDGSSAKQLDRTNSLPGWEAIPRFRPASPVRG
jgi:hypothetical protein